MFFRRSGGQRAGPLHTASPSLTYLQGHESEFSPSLRSIVSSFAPPEKTRRTGDAKQRFGLQVVCIALHVLLIGLHLGLVAVRRVHAEHKLFFDIHLQSMASLFFTVLATAIGTVRLDVFCL